MAVRNPLVLINGQINELPAGDTVAGSSGGGTSSGGYSPWTLVTSNTTTVDGDRLLVDSTAGSVTITLPASPITGASVQIAESSGWLTNPVYINPNGHTVEGIADTIQLDISNTLIQLMYSASTWQVTTTRAAGGASGTSTGDINGPTQAINNSIAVYDGTTGKLVKDSQRVIPTGNVVGTTDIQSLTNKAIAPRVVVSPTPVVGDATFLTINSSITDVFDCLNIPTGATSVTFEAPSGTPYNGQKLLVRVKDLGTSTVINFRQTGGANTFRPIGVTIPVATNANKYLYVSCCYNSYDSKWDVIGITEQA